MAVQGSLPPVDTEKRSVLTTRLIGSITSARPEWLGLLMLAFCLTSCAVSSDEAGELLVRSPTPVPLTAKQAAGSAIEPTELPVQTPTLPALSLDSDSETIMRRMLGSFTTWQSLWADIRVTYYPPEGSNENPQAFHFQVWVDQREGRFKELFGPPDGEPTNLRVTDGESLLEMDVVSGEAELTSLPGFAREPATTFESQGDVIIPHPLGMVLGPATGDLVFPSGLAQRGGTYEAVKLDEVAGRDALVVDWSREGAGRVDRFWLDIHTGVILRWQNFGKGGGEEVQSEHIVTGIMYDAALSADLFTLAPALLPQFVDASGNPLATGPTPYSVDEGTDPLGHVYFFLMNQGYPIPEVRLVRLPGPCVTREATCPEPEIVPTPFKLQFTLTPLVWSPDGRVAAYAYPIREDGNWSGLHLFDPVTGSWTVLAEFLFIDPPLWSPDGAWIAFRVQDGEGGEAIWAVRPDGTDLRNLTAAEGLPQEKAPYWAEGWVGSSILLHPQGPTGDLAEGDIYALDPASGRLQRFSSGSFLNSMLVPSPDGELIAAVSFGTRSISLRLLGIDGTVAQELVTFQGGSIYPGVWSPDGEWLAFGHTDESAQGPSQDLYLIGRAGGGLRQVYSGASVDVVAFSPDGGHLLIGGISAIGQRLYVVSILSMEQRLLRAPGMNLDESWIAPSWRPSIVP